MGESSRSLDEDSFLGRRGSLGGGGPSGSGLGGGGGGGEAGEGGSHSHHSTPPAKLMRLSFASPADAKEAMGSLTVRPMGPMSRLGPAHSEDQRLGPPDGAAEPRRDEDFAKPDALRDFAFVVEGRRLYLNATYLSIMSPVFQVMTQGEFREARAKEAELREKSYEDVLELFRCIYPHPVTKPIDDKNVDLLLEMSREYQIPDLKQRCSEFLREKFEKIRDSPARALELLIIAAKYEMSGLVAAAVPSVAALSLETIDRHAADGSVPIGVAATVYQAKAYKYRDRARPSVGPPGHVMGDRKFIVQGASRRKCDVCRVAGSSKSMDRCHRCEKHLCEACKGEACERNVYNACKSCGKELHFAADQPDSCRCGLTNLSTHFLRH